MGIVVNQMKHCKPVVFFLFTLLITATANVIAKDKYIVFDNPVYQANSEKVEIIEFFWYGCPHCFRLEDSLNNWFEKNSDYVELTKIPANLGNKSLAHAKAFFTAEKLGILESIHPRIYNDINKQNKSLSSISSIRKIFIEAGISALDFDTTYSSSGVREKVRYAQALWSSFALKGVPAIIINRKYGTSLSLAGGSEQMFDVMNMLINMERNTLEK